MGISVSHSSAFHDLQQARRTKKDRFKRLIRQELVLTYQSPISHELKQPILSRTSPPLHHSMFQTISVGTENVSTNEETLEVSKKKGCDMQRNQQSGEAEDFQQRNSQEIASITASSSILGGVCVESSQHIRSTNSMSSTRKFRSFPKNECVTQAQEQTYPIKAIADNQRTENRINSSTKLRGKKNKQNLMLISFAKNATQSFESFDWSVPLDDEMHQWRQEHKIIGSTTLVLPNKFSDHDPTKQRFPAKPKRSCLRKGYKIR